ncbi:MAG TPA: DNA polymerase I, partial [Bacillota bacterium]
MAEAKRPTLLLVDGYSLIHRAFFALPPLHNAEGQPTNAVYGFLNMLLKLLDEERPTHVAVAFDAPGPTFRDELYADYKAQRPSTPDELRSQFPLAREALEALGIPVLEQVGYEADDIIGTLVRRGRADGFDVIVVTGDRDVLQLIDQGVRVLLMRRGISELKVYDQARIREEFGLEPDQLVDVKALMGDPSDNIPGVPGVGEKTALKLIQEFGSVEGVLANLDRVGGKKLPTTLRQYAGIARDSRKLATIVTDVPLELAWETCRRRSPDPERARAIFGRLGFRSLLDRLGLERVQLEAAPVIDAAKSGEASPPIAVTDPAALDELLAAIRQARCVALTYRLTGDDVRRAAVAYLAVAAGGRSWVVLSREGTGHGANPSEAELLRIVDAALTRAAAGEAQLVVHDLKPLLRRGLRCGLWATCPAIFGDGRPGADATAAVPVFDTVIAAYLLDPSRTGYRLADLARQYLRDDLPEPEDLLGKENRRAAAGSAFLARFDRDALVAVAGRQSMRLAAVADALAAELVAHELLDLFVDIEAPLTEVLAAMEHVGVAVDRQALEAMGATFAGRIAELEAEIHALAGTTFNINSTQQLGQVLFERLGLPVVKKTKTGYSTDAEVLEQLAAEHEIARKVLEYRSLVKLMGTYVEGLADEIEDDGRIHTTFQQTVAATGRLASTSPNLQNIPVRDEPGRGLRRAFVAGEGKMLIACDYSQIELRVLAHMSGDERMLEAFRRGDDIHARTAAEVFGVELDAVTPRMRSIAKAVNFGLVYGQTDFGLARQLGISRQEAKEF